MTARSCFPILLIGLLLLTGCQTYSKRLAEFRRRWESADFAGAEAEIDRLLAKESKVDVESIGKTGESLDLERGNTCLMVLEKGMTRLAQGDPESAISLFRKSRDELDRRFVNSTAAVMEQITASVTDDRAIRYAGADYEHIVVRLMLTLSSLLARSGDEYAYATQIGEKQEDIIGSPFGSMDESEQSFKPRSSYQRVAVGAYLQGVIREGELQAGEAGKAYGRAVEYASSDSSMGEPSRELFQSSQSRATDGNFVQNAGDGVLHVFYLGGRGPHLEQVRGTPTEEARLIASIVYTAFTGDWGPIAQKPIPVPAVAGYQGIPTITIRSGDRSATTAMVLDVRHVAEEQLSANMSWILARAIIRRAIKAAGGAIVKWVIDSKSTNSWTGVLASLLFNYVTTAFEAADTRNWTSLPGELQVARLELPEGEHEVDFGNGATGRVRVAAGRDSYAVLLRPDLRQPGVILIDNFSQPVESKDPAPEPEAVGP